MAPKVKMAYAASDAEVFYGYGDSPKAVIKALVKEFLPEDRGAINCIIQVSWVSGFDHPYEGTMVVAG